MSKALFGLALVFMLISLTSAASGPFQINASSAPPNCQAYVHTATPAGQAPNGGNLLGATTITYANVMQNAIVLSFLALSLSFAVIAIGFMLSRVLPNLGIKAWLQMEYIEVTKSAILIAIIFALITIAGNVAAAALHNPPTLNGGNIAPLINGAETYLCNVNYYVMNTWSWMGLLGSGTGFWSNVKIGNYDAIPIWTYAGLISGSVFVPFNNWMLQTGNPMIGPYGSVIGDSINMLLFPFTILNLIAIDTLPSMAIYGLTFFIPLGLFFRGLPFVRGIGGTLIAIGIGLAIVFPSMLILFNGLVMNYLIQSVALAPPAAPLHFVGFNCPFHDAFGTLLAPVLCTTMPWSVNDVVGTVFAGHSLISAVAFTASDEQVGRLNGANVFSDTAVYQYMDIMYAIASYIIVQLVVITIDLVIVYSITDSIARSLGGSVRLQLGSKLRIAS